MLYHLAELLTPHYSGFRVFSYLTLRAILAALTALTIALVSRRRSPGLPGRIRPCRWVP